MVKDVVIDVEDVYIENYVAKKDVYDYFFECFRAYAQWGRSKKLKLS